MWNGLRPFLCCQASYACVHCRARFTQACNLQRHTERCAQGKTVIDCPAERVEAPQTAFEKAFYPKHTASPESLRWLEQEAARWKIHIHHAACGHGGERWVERAPVDGYNHETRTAFQYHGCHWNGCRKCYPNDRDKIITHNDQTREDRFKATVKRTKVLQAAGYHVIEAWVCEVGEIDVELPRPQAQTFPHAILYDFEAYGDKNQRKEPRTTLTIENAHVPISVSVGDTLDREPTNIWEKTQRSWSASSWKSWSDAGKNIRAKYERRVCPTMWRCFQKHSASKSKNGVTRCQFSGSTPGNTIWTWSENISQSAYLTQPAKSEWQKTETRSCSYSFRYSASLTLSTTSAQEPAMKSGRKLMNAQLRNRGFHTSSLVPPKSSTTLGCRTIQRVLTPEGWLRVHSGWTGGMSASVQRKGPAHFRRLAALLQQPRRGPRPGRAWKECEPSTLRKGSTSWKTRSAFRGLACINCCKAWLSGARNFTAPAKKHTTCWKELLPGGRASCSRGTTKSGTRRSGHIRQRNCVFASASLVTTPTPSTCPRCWRKCPAGRKRLFTTRAVGLLEPRRISHKGSKTGPGSDSLKLT